MWPVVVSSLLVSAVSGTEEKGARAAHDDAAVFRERPDTRDAARDASGLNMVLIGQWMKEAVRRSSQGRLVAETLRRGAASSIEARGERERDDGQTSQLLVCTSPGRPMLLPSLQACFVSYQSHAGRLW